MNCKYLADYLSKRLLESGFIVQRYDSYSSNSIYLKLDYGVCNSIRISDHAGKKYLKYRYNIGSFIDKYLYIKDVYPRFYYQAKEKDALLKKIIEDRDGKILRYTEYKYRLFMEKNKNSNSENKGFWKQAKLIKMEDFE